MSMPKHWPKLLVPLLLASVAPASAERFATMVHHGPECPVERAHWTAAAHQDLMVVTVETPAQGGTVLGFGRPSIFAP
jgi:hypothetical protein